MTQGRRIKDALLERYLAGDLAAEAKSTLEAGLAGSPPDRARLEELRADSQAFLTQHPPGQMVARYERAARRRWWALPAVLAPLAAGAFAIGLVLDFPTEDEPSFITKGGVTLTVHLRRGESSERLAKGVELSAKDAVRFELRAPGKGFAAVIGKDSAGKVTVYHPFGVLEAAAYEPAQPLLPTAIELDATKGREQLWGLWSDRPFGLGEATEALRSGSPLEQAVPGVQLGAAELNKR
ncbi:MAG: hypothetical protein HYZ28_03545 [Myxococcales bacterium]|nr:hypothetical protein [Myxococcales bacterium]